MSRASPREGDLPTAHYHDEAHYHDDIDASGFAVGWMIGVFAILLAVLLFILLAASQPWDGSAANNTVPAPGTN
jgi:hypothetical protein